MAKKHVSTVTAAGRAAKSAWSRLQHDATLARRADVRAALQQRRIGQDNQVQGTEEAGRRCTRSRTILERAVL